MHNHQLVINDVTGLNATPVSAIVVPNSIDDVCNAIRQSSAPISIGGGHFSMGGQTAYQGSVHIDLRQLNKIISFSPIDKTIKVQAGIRWCDIQHFLDPHDLSVKIMQTYANFTVGGSLSVNVHGRYVGLGPLILSVRSIVIVLANGQAVTASRTENTDLFNGAIGGYGGLGIIVEAELELAENLRVERIAEKLPVQAYSEHFKNMRHGSRKAIFHNADLYPPHYASLRSVSWVETDKQATEPDRLMPLKKTYPLHRYYLWAVSETPFGKWRREFIVDPILFAGNKVHWRNYEAGYDVAELEPATRRFSTYVLQEYFVPVGNFEAFIPKLREILVRHNVNVINISVRHAMPDTSSLLAWASSEVFAFVLYYKQSVSDSAREQVAIWTRELIEATLAVGGTYYLPYQPHATPDQFHRAYPRANAFFQLKRRYDPDYRFRNSLWNAYYTPTPAAPTEPETPKSDFHLIYGDLTWRDRYFLFLQNIFHVFPEAPFHSLIAKACDETETEEAAYRYIQQRLPGIAPRLAALRYALPALAKQKREMAVQTATILAPRTEINGYVEIGSTGRYVRALKKSSRLKDRSFSSMIRNPGIRLRISLNVASSIRSVGLWI